MPYTLAATACPAPLVPSAISYATDDSPPTSISASTGDNLGGVSCNKLNRDFARLDYAKRFASGFYGLGEGLDLTAGSGLVMNVAAGIVLRDGVLWEKAADTIVLPISASRVFIWATYVAPNLISGEPAAIALDYKTDLTVPTNGICVLGSCSTGASSITGGTIDQSGVMYSKGPEVFRYTGDIGGPGDSPNAALRFYNVSGGGTFFWDGTAWRPIGTTYLAVAGSKADANYTLTQTEWLCEQYKAGWTGWTAGRNLVVPSVTGWRQWITNATGQTLQAIAATGTGITIANNKTALVRFDGTNVVRSTADA